MSFFRPISTPRIEPPYLYQLPFNLFFFLIASDKPNDKLSAVYFSGGSSPQARRLYFDLNLPYELFHMGMSGTLVPRGPPVDTAMGFRHMNTKPGNISAACNACKQRKET